MNPKPTSQTKQLLVPAGRAYWDQLLPDGSYAGERYLGPSDAIPITVEFQTIEELSSETQVATVLDNTVVGIKRSGKAVIKQISSDNAALWLGGEVTDVVQEAAPVLDEAHTLQADRYYQLGATPANPTGVRGVSDLTLATAGVGAGAWAATTTVQVGDLVSPTDGSNAYYRCTTAGDTGASEPTWAADGTTVTDGTAAWVWAGVKTLEDGVDYTLDAQRGRFYVLAGARLPAGRHPVTADYDRAANSREQVRTVPKTTNEGRLRIVADNPKGANRDWFLPSVLLTSTGEMPAKAENANVYAKLNFVIKINEPDPGPLGETISAIYLDGQPYEVVP